MTRHAVQAALDNLPERRSFAERVARFRAENPLPPRSGLEADKVFFDGLSGNP